MSSSFSAELEVAMSAVRQAAVVCRSVQSAITTDAVEKKDRSPVTVADYGSQAIICRAIRDAFPDDPIIGEEDSADLRSGDHTAFRPRVASEVNAAGVDASEDDVCNWIDYGSAKEFTDRFWTLDPIDGTKGFLRGEQYAISLALIISGEIRVAVVGCPNLPPAADDASETGAMFFAVRGEGSWTRSFDDDSGRPVHVSVCDQAADARFCESVESGHSSHGKSAQAAELLGITRDPVRLDSQAKYVVVARGEAEAYLRLPTRKDYNEKIWDHAGGVLVVEEAGGRVTDVTGKPLEFHHGHELIANRGVIVSNGPLHDAVLQALSDVGVK